MLYINKSSVVHSCRVAIIHNVKNVHFIVASCQWQLLSIIRDLFELWFHWKYHRHMYGRCSIALLFCVH